MLKLVIILFLQIYFYIDKGDCTGTILPLSAFSGKQNLVYLEVYHPREQEERTKGGEACSGFIIELATVLYGA